MTIELSEIDFDNIGLWPTSVKVIVCLLTFTLILGMGYWFDIRGQLAGLHKAQEKEVTLRKEIATHQAQVLPIKELKQQIETVKTYLDNTLKKMPSSAEIPKILEDISAQGIKSGLEFRSIRPLPEVLHKFYAQTPISMVLVGNYHQLGKFVADLAALRRYIVVTDFSLKELVEKQERSSGRNKNVRRTPTGYIKLTMTLEANIYRSIPLE